MLVYNDLVTNILTEDVKGILIEAGGGDETIDVSRVDSSTFPNIDSQHFQDVDPNVTQHTGILIYARGGNDVVFGSAYTDVVYGDQGDDRIFGNEGEDRLFGNDGNNTIFGGAGNDKLHGGVNDDALYGQEGDDNLYGDWGNDLLDGGTGASGSQGQCRVL